MNKNQAQAVAAVLCRAMDYWQVRESAERAGPLTPEGKELHAERLAGAQGYLADALEAVQDED